MKFSAVLPFFLSTLAMAAPIDDAEQTESTSDDKPPPSQVSIRGVKWNGSGCPSNGVQSIINADATIVTLLFSNYTASVGQGISRAEGRKNCQVSLDLQYPSGYAYSVADVTIRGYIDIDAGVTATVQSRYYFQGMTGGHDAISKYDINGPFHNSFSKSDGIPVESLVWSPCGARAAAQINNDIRLVANKQGAGGAASVDSLDAKFTTRHSFQYAFNWKKINCAGSKARPVMQKMNVEESVVNLDV